MAVSFSGRGIGKKRMGVLMRATKLNTGFVQKTVVYICNYACMMNKS